MTEYELTRRDAIVALGASGIAVGAGALTWDSLANEDTEGFSQRQRETLVALADTIYPSDVTNVESFVEQYSVGRVRDRGEYRTGMAEALDALEEYARTWEERPYHELSGDDRDELLREFGVDTADSDPVGRAHERVRYYLVNELQYALYSTPTGGELVGLENPQGHPGGTESYQRPPERE